MNSYSQPYEELIKILDHIKIIPSAKKVKYKDELNSVLYAIMIAHDLIQISDIDDDKDIRDYPEFCLDREWIREIAESIKTHYKKGNYYSAILSNPVETSSNRII